MEYYKAKENHTLTSGKLIYQLEKGELLTFNDLAIRGLGCYLYLFERVELPKSAIQIINTKRYIKI
jgi:hypothetical protein